MIKIDYYDAALIASVIATFYFYFKSQYYRLKSFRRKVTRHSDVHTERTELEKKRFMKNSENKWGVIK